MTDSELTPQRAYVWTWLPGQVDPVVAGLVEAKGRDYFRFAYGESYVNRADAISLYTPELPLGRGWVEPLTGLKLAGSLRDASPDAWGRHVIESRLGAAEGALSEIGYMLGSGSNRFGAIDFQISPAEYVTRLDTAPLEELHEAALRIEAGRPLSQVMLEALVRGTAIGGARPKVLVSEADGSEWIAKLSAASDVYFSVVNAEATALELARRSGISVPEFRVTSSLGREILLVRRFDRDGEGHRRHVVSALTIMGLDEVDAVMGGSSYPMLLDRLRRFGSDARVGRELFARIAFSIAISNSDDHARNHAAFWDGAQLELTPAYDLAPGPRSGETATQAMGYDADGRLRESNFASLLGQARVYGLSESEGRAVIDRIVATISDDWEQAADVGRLSARDRAYLRGRQFLNPGTLYGY